VIGDGESSRDLAGLVVPFVGGLVGTGDRYEPYQLVEADGLAVKAVSAYFQDLLATGRAEATRPFVRDGLAALVAFLVGCRGSLGSGDSVRGL
jgi:hypothetical protein